MIETIVQETVQLVQSRKAAKCEERVTVEDRKQRADRACFDALTDHWSGKRHGKSVLGELFEKLICTLDAHEFRESRLKFLIQTTIRNIEEVLLRGNTVSF